MVTIEAVTASCHRRAATLDNPGFCIVCGAQAVYGDMELLLHLVV